MDNTINWIQPDESKDYFLTRWERIDGDVEHDPEAGWAWSVRPSIIEGGGSDFYAMGVEPDKERAFMMAQMQMRLLRLDMEQHPQELWFPHPT